MVDCSLEFAALPKTFGILRKETALRNECTLKNQLRQLLSSLLEQPVIEREGGRNHTHHDSCSSDTQSRTFYSQSILEKQFRTKVFVTFGNFLSQKQKQIHPTRKFFESPLLQARENDICVGYPRE